MKIDIALKSKLSGSVRTRQLASIFDVPYKEAIEQKWQGEFDIESKDWNIGLIVGPSGSGKTSILDSCFDKPESLKWGDRSVIDDFSEELSIEQIAQVCEGVGFNTIPAWLRPYRVLSTGEQFRVEMARRLIESPDGKPLVIDEFTSVVDRQVAKVASHAVQKTIRRLDKRLVAASCHYDIIDWLQPDWILEPHLMSLRWRRLRSRPRLDIAISPVDYSAWELFAPFHYLTASLTRSAKCFALFVEGQPASFLAVRHQPHWKTRNLVAATRTVTLPDWQGLGLIHVLHDKMGACLKTIGKRFRKFPSHPAFVRSHDKSSNWALVKRPGIFPAPHGRNAKIPEIGRRPCAVFEYVGPAAPLAEARRLLGDSYGVTKALRTSERQGSSV